jgi:hypothetical protein
MDGVLGGFRLSFGPRYSGSFTPDPELPVDGTTLVRLGFEEGAGTTLSDQSSGAFDGTILGNAAWLSTCPEEDLDGDGIESWMDCDDSDATLTVPDGSANCPGLSCREILDNDASVVDGTYWIDPNGTGAFEAYCDMTQDDGGWTQVARAIAGQATFATWNQDGALNSSDALDTSSTWHLSKDAINALTTDNLFRVDCSSTSDQWYWTGVDDYSWTSSTVASSANSAYDGSGTSYPTTWAANFHWGLIALPEVVTSHGDNGQAPVVNPWACDASHLSDMKIWAR